jgi:hypothetical protein
MQTLKWKHVLWTISLVGFAIALLDRQPTPLSYISLPAATILLELALIATLLEKESALYDQQREAARLGRTCLSAGQPPRPPTIFPDNCLSRPRQDSILLSLLDEMTAIRARFKRALFLL